MYKINFIFLFIYLCIQYGLNPDGNNMIILNIINYNIYNVLYTNKIKNLVKQYFKLGEKLNFNRKEIVLELVIDSIR